MKGLPFAYPTTRSEEERGGRIHSTDQLVCKNSVYNCTQILRTISSQRVKSSEYSNFSCKSDLEQNLAFEIEGLWVRNKFSPKILPIESLIHVRWI
ncbi:hypothetical protein AVEN_2465-1 [Araneus ventricosus]|uniref:Uncharacterized protein n=1 Tax=Araneus ventricosus TaxID=182803 RepID=A0A4Y2VUV5_ARAVE|nr:hypothetical protein AVEN_2465-1 [Araneus ventricosus]